jgi:hypothetical protein
MQSRYRRNLNFSDEAEAKINSLVRGQSILLGIFAPVFKKLVQMVSRFGPDLVQIWSRFRGPDHQDQFRQPPRCQNITLSKGCQNIALSTECQNITLSMECQNITLSTSTLGRMEWSVLEWRGRQDRPTE